MHTGDCQNQNKLQKKQQKCVQTKVSLTVKQRTSINSIMFHKPEQENEFLPDILKELSPRVRRISDLFFPAWKEIVFDDFESLLKNIMNYLILVCAGK